MKTYNIQLKKKDIELLTNLLLNEALAVKPKNRKKFQMLRLSITEQRLNQDIPERLISKQIEQEEIRKLQRYIEKLGFNRKLRL